MGLGYIQGKLVPGFRFGGEAASKRAAEREREREWGESSQGTYMGGGSQKYGNSPHNFGDP